MSEAEDHQPIIQPVNCPAPSGETKLWNKNFILACCSNFILWLAFYQLLPVLPLYLASAFEADKGTIGLVLASYTLGVLLTRPFSGYVVDTFDRKKIFILFYILFAVYFLGYVVAGGLLFFFIVRATHGIPFAMLSTSNSTVAIDVMPSAKRGTGIGFLGMSSSIAMALGPTAGIYTYQHWGFHTVFISAFLMLMVGVAFVSFLKTPYKPEKKVEALSLDRFILVKGVYAMITLLSVSFIYGMMTTYMAVYLQEQGMERGAGLFFVMMAMGLLCTRFVSGPYADKGFVTPLVILGNCLAVASFIGILLTGHLWLIYVFAFLIGVSYGLMIPAYQLLFINLAPNNKRGTANSTFYTAWDLGIGLGVLAGGFVSDFGGYGYSFAAGIVALIFSVIFFSSFTAGHFKRNRLR